MEKLYTVLNFLFWLNLLVIASDGTKEIKYAKNILSSCESHRDCKDLKYSQCLSGRCRCLSNYYKRNSNVCLGDINATCDSDYDCRHNHLAGCISNICQSYATFFAPSNAEEVKLYRAERIGSGCVTDENCSDLNNTLCTSGKCECVKGYWKANETCQLVTNTTCINHSDCKESGTKCLLNNCVLPTDFFIESNTRYATLYAAERLNDVCQTDHHCRNINHSKCINGACKCGRGTLPSLLPSLSSPSGGQCRQTLNFYCEKDSECVYYYKSKCFFNNCSIAEDFFIPENAHKVSVYAATHIRDVCRADHHCRNIENTQCIEDQCRCKMNFTNINGKCRKLSDLFCSHDSDCKKYGFDYWCFLNACHQGGDYFDTADTSQWKTKWIKGYCRTNLHCSNLNNTRCFLDQCVCRYGYKYESGECKEDSPTNCSKDSQCSGWAEKCILGQCQSPDRFFESARSDALDLYAVNRFYGACRTDHHCRNFNNSRCLDNQCRCFRGWDLVSGGCQRTINITCSDDSKCRRYGTFCFLNNCLYPENFFDSSNINQSNVYAAKRIYGYCQSNHHCRELSNTYCFEDRCNCLSGHENVNGSCIKAINIFCSNDSECLLPRSYCFLNTCLYPEDFFDPVNGYNTSLYVAQCVGGFCQADQHCRNIQGSKCFRRKCSCANDYSINGTECNNVTLIFQ